MGQQLILFAVPGFFALMFAEMAASRALRRGYYAASDTLNDLSMGVLQQVAALFYNVVLLGVYGWIYGHLRVFEVPHTALGWAGAFVAWDFFYYWAHRSMHEVNVLWASHAPHHQSEEYNLAVALRQGVFQAPLTCFFFWPLALAGVDVEMYLVVGGLNLVYQFWIHTRFVRSLGVIELVMNTPSHHRVHHGKNRRYLDRNHGGVFIVWDRLFGTFTREDEEPVYGTLEPLASWNPLWGQVKYLVHLARIAARSGDRFDLARIWFAPSGWAPAGTVEPLDLDAPPPPRYAPPVSRGRARYAAAQFALTAGLALVLLGAAPHFAPAWRVLLALQVAVGLTGVGGVLEGKVWVRWLEPSRMVALAATAVAWWAR